MTIQSCSAASAVSVAAILSSRRQIAASEPAKSADKVTISQAARDLAAQENKIIPAADDPKAAAKYMQHMAEGFAGMNQQRAAMASDPSNPLYAKWINEAAQQNFSTGTGNGAGIDLSWGKTADNLSRMDPVHYIGGELVTPASQEYQQKQVHIYMNAAAQLYQSEKAKGTAPGNIIIKIMDLQGQQPARFRAMMGWPIAADFANDSNINVQAQTTVAPNSPTGASARA